MARNTGATSTSSDEGGEDVDWFLQALSQRAVDIPGSILMSSPMLVYSAFSGGSQRAGGESWSDRLVIGVPLHPYPAVSAEPEGSWAFFLDRSNSSHGTQKQWAFIRYGPDEEEDVSCPSTEERTERTSTSQSEQASATPDDDAGPSLAPGAPGQPSRSSVAPQDEVRTRRGKVYDLRGFLRCMAEEGRPSPPEELAAALENTLYMRHQHDGSLFCPLMGDEDAPMGVPVIPQVPVRDVPGDVMTRISFTLATGIPSRFRGGN